MKTLPSSVERFLQGELDLEELTMQLQELIKDSPEDTEKLLEQVTQLYRNGRISAADNTRLESTLVPIKGATTDSVQSNEELTKLATAARAATTRLPNTLKQPAEQLRIGSIIRDRFTVVEVLGQGGMGVVYKAQDKRKIEARDRKPFVALKVLSENFKQNPDSFIALQREARKSQDLAHPNIVTVYDFDTDGPHVYMTMECLEGKPLGTLMYQPEFNSKPVKERWSIIRQIGQALRYAHEKNIIHSDLKPGNIFVNDTGIVKVLDFGIARAAKDNEQKRADTTVFDAGVLQCLTPAYASCEMLEHQPADFRDDIYAYGCVAYGILAGTHPFNKLPATQARNNCLKPAPIKGINRRQWRALKHALEFERENRTPTVKKFLREIQLQGEPWVGGRFFWWIGTLLFAVLTFGGLYLYNTQILNPMPESPAYPQPNPNLTAQEKAKINRLVAIAEMHIAVDRISEPAGSNALFAYRQVLKIDPGDKQAKRGLERIAEYYVIRTQEMLQKGEGENAMKMAKAGLKAVPRHRILLTLYQQTKQKYQK